MGSPRSTTFTTLTPAQRRRDGPHRVHQYSQNSSNHRIPRATVTQKRLNRRQPSLTLAFRPVVGGLEPRPRTQCPPPGSGGGENLTGSTLGNHPRPEDGLPARRAGKAEAIVAPAVPRLDAATHGYTAIRCGVAPAPAAANPRHAISDTIWIRLTFLPPVVLSISV